METKPQSEMSPEEKKAWQESLLKGYSSHIFSLDDDRKIAEAEKREAEVAAQEEERRRKEAEVKEKPVVMSEWQKETQRLEDEGMTGFGSIEKRVFGEERSDWDPDKSNTATEDNVK